MYYLLIIHPGIPGVVYEEIILLDNAQERNREEE